MASAARTGSPDLLQELEQAADRVTCHPFLYLALMNNLGYGGVQAANTLTQEERRALAKFHDPPEYELPDTEGLVRFQSLPTLTASTTMMGRPFLVCKLTMVRTHHHFRAHVPRLACCC